MAVAAAALVALMVAVWLYRTILPPGAGGAGGCGFSLVVGAAVAGLVGGAIWLWRLDDD